MIRDTSHSHIQTLSTCTAPLPTPIPRSSGSRIGLPRTPVRVTVTGTCCYTWWWSSSARRATCVSSRSTSAPCSWKASGCSLTRYLRTFARILPRANKPGRCVWCAAKVGGGWGGVAVSYLVAGQARPRYCRGREGGRDVHIYICASKLTRLVLSNTNPLHST